MKRYRALPFTMVALAILILASVAHADSVGITLIQISQTGAAGSTVTFDATLTNLTGNTVFLNGDSSATSSLFLTVDDTPFLTNAPLWLAPSASSGPFALFNVLIDPNMPVGTYDFNSFSILGGVDGNAFDTLGTANFSVVTATPEPGTLVLILCGLLTIGMFAQFRGLGRTN
jgi:hypothetical protein